MANTLAVVLGTWRAVAAAPRRSGASRTVNTSFVERHHGTDRHRSAEVAEDLPVQQGLADARGDDLLHHGLVSFLLAGADAPRALGEDACGGGGLRRWRPVWRIMSGHSRNG